MPKLNLHFQTKIILLLLVSFVVMSAGIFILTYTILYRSMLDRYYNQGAFLVESSARTLNKENFEKLAASLDDTESFFDELRIYLFRIKEANSLENFYTATLGSDGSTLVYVVDGNERFSDLFTPPGTSLAESGRNREAALTAFNKGKPTQSEPYSTVEGKRLISVYYPVFDKANKVLGIVVCDFDFKQIMRSVYSDLGMIMITIGVFAVATITAILIFFRISLISAVNSIQEYLQYLASGDLSNSFSEKLLERPDEIGTIVRALENARKSFREMIQSVLDETAILKGVTQNTISEINNLNVGINEIADTTQQISAGMEETAASSEEMDATANQIVHAIQSIADKADKGTVVAGEIKERAQSLRGQALRSQESGKNITEEVNIKLKKALDQSTSVGHINSLADSILNITEQTNLLALNAAIEAARAGDSGKGFTVVADEIMKLATESQETASQIIDVTKEVLDSVSNLTESSQQVLDYIDQFVVRDYEVMVNTGKQYSEDAQVIEEITSDFQETSEQLLVSIQHTIKAIEEISKSAQQGSEETAQIATNTTILNQEAGIVMKLSHDVTETLNKLSERLNVFKV